MLLPTVWLLLRIVKRTMLYLLVSKIAYSSISYFYALVEFWRLGLLGNLCC